jgi:hypothetical protein
MRADGRAGFNLTKRGNCPDIALPWIGTTNRERKYQSNLYEKSR